MRPWSALDTTATSNLWLGVVLYAIVLATCTMTFMQASHGQILSSIPTPSSSISTLSFRGHFHIDNVILSSRGQDNYITSCHSGHGGGPGASGGAAPGGLIAHTLTTVFITVTPAHAHEHITRYHNVYTGAPESMLTRVYRCPQVKPAASNV